MTDIDAVHREILSRPAGDPARMFLEHHRKRQAGKQPKTEAEAVKPVVPEPLKRMEKAGQDMIERIKEVQEKFEQGPPPGPYDDDLWKMNSDLPLVKEEPGATETDEGDTQCLP